MPENKSYRVNGQIYDIPDTETGAFLKDFPNAIEVEAYTMGKDTFDIPITEREAFLKDNPTAQPVKKKEPSLLDFLEQGQNYIPGLPGSEKPLAESFVQQQQLPSKPKDTGAYAGDILERIGAGAIDIATSGPKQIKFAERVLDLPKKLVKKELGLLGLSDETAERITSAIPYLKMGQIGEAVGLASNVWDKIEKTDDFKNLEKKADDLRESSARYDKTITEYLKNKEYKKAIGASFLSAAESLPLTLGAAFGGGVGLAAIGSYSASAQYDELAPNTDMGELTKITNAMLNGGLEILTERMGSANYGKLIKGLYKSAGKEVAEQAVKSGTKSWLVNMFKKMGIYTAPVGEGIEEAVNQFGSNITARITGEDPDRPLDYGVIESAMTGAASGSVFTAIGLPAQLRQKQYEDVIKEKEKLAKEQTKKPTKTTDKGKVTTEVGELKVPKEEDNLGLSKEEIKEMEGAEQAPQELISKEQEEPTDAEGSRVEDQEVVTEGAPELVGQEAEPGVVRDDEQAGVSEQEEVVKDGVRNRIEIPITQEKGYPLVNGERLTNSPNIEKYEELMSQDDDSWVYYLSANKIIEYLENEKANFNNIIESEKRRAGRDNKPYDEKITEWYNLLTSQADEIISELKKGDRVESDFLKESKTVKDLNKDFAKGKLNVLVWNADGELSGDAERAIDEWVGLTKEQQNQGLEAGIFNEKSLEDLLIKNPTVIDKIMAPLKEYLKSKYGNNITLYRVEDVDFKKRQPRTLLSYTSDPLRAQQFYDKGRTKLYKEQVPIDDIVWLTNRFGQHEFIVKSPQEEVVPPKDESKVSTKDAQTDNKVEEVQHKAKIEQKFRESFSGQPQEQVDGALALMEARAKSWASEEKGRTTEQWYQRIADVKSGEFQEGTPKLYQLPNGSQVMGLPDIETTNGFYSPIEKRLTEFKQEKASVNKWKEIIGKGDEATFTGVRDWLDKMNPAQSLTKAEINQFMKTTGIQLKEGGRTHGMFETIEKAEQFIKDNDMQGVYAKYEPRYNEYSIRRLDNNGTVSMGEFPSSQQHSIDITPQLKAEVEKGLPLFQKGKGKPKGAVETLADGKVIIHALSNPDFSTMVHEIVHVFEKDLTPQEISVIEKWSGKKQGTREFSEAFARGGERYLRDGVSPTKELTPIFEKFKKWLTDIYSKLKGSPIEKKLSPEVRKVFDRLLTSKEAESATISKEQGGTPTPPQSPSETQEKGGKTKFRKTQINSLIQDQTLQQQEVAKIVDANKERYKVLHQEEAVALAKEMIDNLGVQGASLELEGKTKKMEDFPVRQVARQILLDFYSRAIIDPNAKEADKKVAFEHIDRLQQITAREATKAGQGNSLLQIWKSMQPAGVLEFVARKIQQANDIKLGKKKGDSTLGEQLDDLYGTLSEESKKIIADILSGKIVSIPQEGVKTKPPSARKYVPRERIKQEQDYRKSIIEQYKKTQGGVMSASVTGLTSAQIELGGNLLASYVREGYYRIEDVLQKLAQDFKEAGIVLDDKQKEEILSTPRTDKQTYGEYLSKKETQAKEREAEKFISKKISDVITAHWSEKDELKRTLAQKLIDEVGLSETDAKRIEKEVLEKFDKEILERSQKQLTKLLGVQKIPTEKKKKGIVGKMIELINLGALDEELYRDLFAEKFNLAKLSDEHKTEIMRLANNVQLASGKGWLERDATIRLAKYIYELYPLKKSSEMSETWLAMAYANMLFGISTSVLNLASAGSNLATKPIRDVTNLSKWLRMIKAGKGAPDIYNPIGEMLYGPALRGISMGAKEAAEVYINGDLNNKYIEDIAKKSHFKVTQLERDKYGKAKRFKPVTVKMGNRSIDLNIFNLYKYSGRNLSAQDKLMLNTSYEIELAHILRDKLRSKTLHGRALTKEVMRIFNGEHLDMDEINATLESDNELYKKMTGTEMSSLQKAIRKRELVLEQLPITPEEKEEAEMLARSNIFTDDRAGLFGTLASGLGYIANSSPIAGAIVKPFVPFTKVVGNVAEYMMDHVPFYGLLRANGWSISALKKLVDAEIPTAQMGARGSRAYYEQMGRAWFGTLTFSVALLMFLGNDDEDDIEISGGYNKEGFKKRGRENVLPPYTLRIKNVKIPYKNIPSLAIPLSLIGNINDALKDKRDEGDLMERMTVALLLDAVFNSVFMVKDMSFLDGVQRGTQIISDAASADEKKWGQIGEGLIKSYLGFATRPLPQNNNAIQQIWKVFDPTSYSQSEIKGMLGYAMGIQHFTNKPTIDQLGNTITSYPGETLMPYTHWLNIKGKDERWKFLAKYNAIPNKIYNRTMQIEGQDGIEKRKLEEDELYDYTFRAGGLFSDSLEAYMEDTAKVEKRAKDILEREKSNGEIEKISGIREDVEKLWQKAKDEAEMELFRWGSVKETMPEVWGLIKKHKAYFPYSTSKETDDYKWSKEDLYMFNNLATVRYAERIKNFLKTANVEALRKQDSDRDGINNFQERLNREWGFAKDYAEKQMRTEIMSKAREKAKNK